MLLALASISIREVGSNFGSKMLLLNGQNTVKFWVVLMLLQLEHMYMSSIIVRISSYLLANSAIRIQIKNMELDGFHVRKMQKLLGWRHIKYFLTRPSKNKMLSHHHLSSSWLIALSCVCHHLGKWKILEFEDKISTPNVVYYPELYESNI